MRQRSPLISWSILKLLKTNMLTKNSEGLLEETIDQDPIVIVSTIDQLKNQLYYYQTIILQSQDRVDEIQKKLETAVELGVKDSTSEKTTGAVDFVEMLSIDSLSTKDTP